MLSLALPVVWMILFSRMVVLKSFRPRVMASTAMGIEAETVSPAFKARNTVEAPNRIPKILPISRALKVSSFISVSGLTKGWNFFADMCIRNSFGLGFSVLNYGIQRTYADEDQYSPNYT